MLKRTFEGTDTVDDRLWNFVVVARVEHCNMRSKTHHFQRFIAIVKAAAGLLGRR